MQRIKSLQMCAQMCAQMSAQMRAQMRAQMHAQICPLHVSIDVSIDASIDAYTVMFSIYKTRLHSTYQCGNPTIRKDSLFYAPPELIFCLSFPCKHRSSCLSYGSCNFILQVSRVDMFTTGYTFPTNSCVHQFTMNTRERHY